MVDLTVGHGGHSYLFGKTLGPGGLIVGFDVDDQAIEIARQQLGSLGCKVVLIRANFAEALEQLQSRRLGQADFVLADLGLCFRQVMEKRYGLSFQTDMPLDMRIDKRLKTTAADIINNLDERSLAELIYKYGQERACRRIARFIVNHRQKQPIQTTAQLAQLVCRAVMPRGRKRRIHPATRTFQALRIAVNDELGNLEKMLARAPALLKTGGHIAVISYHSLEDRLVKNSFRHNEKLGIFRIVTKKPIVPTAEEIASNKRARSAKLRIAQKISETGLDSSYLLGLVN